MRIFYLWVAYTDVIGGSTLSDNTHKIRTFYKEGFNDPFGAMVKRDIVDLGISGVDEVKRLPTYILQGRLSDEEIAFVSHELLADSILQYYIFGGSESEARLFKDFDWFVEVELKAGVTDSVAQSVCEGIKVIGIEGTIQVQTSITYLIKGDLSRDDIEYVCLKILANPLIHNYYFRRLT